MAFWVVGAGGGMVGLVGVGGVWGAFTWVACGVVLVVVGAAGLKLLVVELRGGGAEYRV